MKPWVRHPGACAALVVAVVVGAPLLAGQRFSGLDHTRNLVPTLCAHEDGHSVLDPLRGDGTVLEDPLGLVFSPVARPLELVLSPEDAASAFDLVWLVLAASSASFLAASFGASWRGRLLAGVALPLAGTSIDLVLHGPYVVESALVPLTWAGARNLRRRKPRVVDALAVGAGLALLALHGDLQMALCAGLLVVAEAIAAVVPRRGERRRAEGSAAPRVGALAASALAGTLVACLQLLPSTGLGAAVARAHGVESTTAWPLELPEALGVLLPIRAYARVDVGATLVTAFHGDAAARTEWNCTPFLGALALACLLVAVLPRRTRPLFVVGAVSALFALGAHTPAFPLASAVFFPLRLFRYPAKYFELTSICAVVALAVVVDAAPRCARLRRRLLFAVAALAGLLALGLAALLVERHAVDAAAARVATHAPFDGLPTLAGMLVTATLTSTGFAVVAALACARPRLARTLPFVAAAELALAAFTALPTSPPLFSGDTAAPRPLQSLVSPGSASPALRGLVCIGRDVHALHLDGAGPGGSRTELSLYGDTLADVVDGKPNVGACGGPATPDDYMPSAQHTVVQLSRYRQDEAHGVLGPARALGCGYIVTRAQVPGAERVPLPPAPGAPSVYAVSDPLPAAAVARSPALVDDEATLLARITASTTSVELLALVDDPAASLRAHGVAALPRGDSAGAARASFASPTEGRVVVDGAGGALVVLRRQWWPGWSATQQGVDLPVVRVAGRELGVVVADVARGPVELRYRVRGLGLGVALALVGLALFAAVAVAIRRRR